MLRLARRRRRHTDLCNSKIIDNTMPAACSNRQNFVQHISQYIGETVTVFTGAGGDAGSGFTGILLDTNDVYVQLLTQAGPAPMLAFFQTLGTVTYIPSGMITALTHSSLR